MCIGRILRLVTNRPAATEEPLQVPPVDPNLPAHLRERHIEIETKIAKAERAKPKAARRMRIMQVVQVSTGIGSLIGGINRLKEDVYCYNPLPVWLVVHFAITFFGAIMFYVGSCLQWRAGALPAIYRPFMICGSVVLLGQMCWIIVGAVWTWGPHGDDCDSGARSAAQTIIIVSLVVTAVLFTLGFYQGYQAAKLRKDKREMQKEIEVETAALAARNPIDPVSEPPEDVHRDPLSAGLELPPTIIDLNGVTD